MKVKSQGGVIQCNCLAKIIVVSLSVIPGCQAASNGQESNWIRAIQQYQPIKQQKKLDLSNKQIEGVPSGLDLPKLEVLDLQDNKILTLPTDLKLPRLQELHLMSNQIATMPVTLDLPQLEWLDLENNQITAIPADLLFSQLRVLDLKGNQVRTVDLEVFQRLPNLTCLDLDRNPITHTSVHKLRVALAKTHPHLEIIAGDIGPQYDKGPQYRFGARVRGLQSK